MVKALINVLLISLTLSACGGARSPNHTTGGNSSLSWQAPTTYLDQSPIPLSEIGGYKIYVGTDEGSMSLNTNINDPTVTSFDLNKLGKGVFHIAVTCYDVYGIESNYSPVIVINLI